LTSPPPSSTHAQAETTATTLTTKQSHATTTTAAAAAVAAANAAANAANTTRNVSRLAPPSPLLHSLADGLADQALVEVGADEQRLEADLQLVAAVQLRLAVAT
jgi:hypothetical protein